MQIESYDKINEIYWFSDMSKTNNLRINSNDINLLVTMLRNIIFNDFFKIKKLAKYLAIK